MKKVLIITYYFPPIGGAGVQRNLKFIKYLPDFGYQPIIFTPNPKLIRYHSYDRSLLAEIPKNTVIYHSFIIDLNWIFKLLYGVKLTKFVSFLKRKYLFPDYERQWISFAELKLKKIINKEKPELVFVSSPPYSTQILADWIKLKYNLPIVSDFRDPLTFNYQKRDDIKKQFNFERKSLSNCDFIVANTPINKKIYIENFQIPESKITVITNGFDKADFEKIGKTEKHNQKLIFSHVGQLYGEHNATALLRAISSIKEKLTDVEFRFVGKVTFEDRKLVRKSGLSDLVKFRDYCSHREALKYNLESDFLIILLPNEKWSYCIPGKTFESIYSGKKILAIVPETGSCAEIIRKTGTGVVVSPDRLDKIADQILSFITEHKKGIHNYDPDKEEIMKYERKFLTGRLASVFDIL